MAMTSRNLSTGWINIWISLGLFVTLIGLFLPAYVRNNVRLEVQRYQECAAGRRDDCKASLVWIFYEQALRREGGSESLLQ